MASFLWDTTLIEQATGFRDGGYMIDVWGAGYDLVDEISQIHVPEWSRGRIALIGDAAYCPSLLAGAGSAFAMLGAYVLAGELKMSNGDYRVVFAAYETVAPFMEAR